MWYSSCAGRSVGHSSVASSPSRQWTSSLPSSSRPKSTPLRRCTSWKKITGILAARAAAVSASAREIRSVYPSMCGMPDSLPGSAPPRWMSTTIRAGLPTISGWRGMVISSDLDAGVGGGLQDVHERVHRDVADAEQQGHAGDRREVGRGDRLSHVLPDAGPGEDLLDHDHA